MESPFYSYTQQASILLAPDILPFVVTNNLISFLINHNDTISCLWGNELLPNLCSFCTNLSAIEVERSLQSMNFRGIRELYIEGFGRRGSCWAETKEEMRVACRKAVGAYYAWSNKVNLENKFRKIREEYNNY